MAIVSIILACVALGISVYTLIKNKTSKTEWSNLDNTFTVNGTVKAKKFIEYN